MRSQHQGAPKPAQGTSVALPLVSPARLTASNKFAALDPDTIEKMKKHHAARLVIPLPEMASPASVSSATREVPATPLPTTSNTSSSDESSSSSASAPTADVEDEIDWDKLSEMSVSELQSSMMSASSIEEEKLTCPEFVVLYSNGRPTKFRIPVSLGPLFAGQVGEKRDSVTGLLLKWNHRSFHATSGVASSYRKELPKFTIADYWWTLPSLADCHGDFGLLLAETLVAISRATNHYCRLEADVAFKTVLKGTEGLVEWEHVVTLFPRATLGEIVLRVWTKLHSVFLRVRAIQAVLVSRHLGTIDMSKGHGEADYYRLRAFLFGHTLSAEREATLTFYLQHPHVAEALSYVVERERTSLPAELLELNFLSAG